MFQLQFCKHQLLICQYPHQHLYRQQIQLWLSFCLSSSNNDLFGTHPKQTRSKSRIFKPSAWAHIHACSKFLSYSILTMCECKGVKITVKHPGWLVAVDEELRILHQNYNSDLVPRPPSKNIVGSKWVFHS